MLETLGRIGFDWPVALANLINFIIIFLVLKKFAFKPIQKIIEERQKKIDEGLENAQKAETSLMMAEEIRNKKIDEARVKSNEIIGVAQTKSNTILADTQEQSLKMKEKIIADGEMVVAETKKKIKSEVEKEMSGLIIEGVEKVLRENLTPETQKTYIKRSLAAYAAKK